jgi:hypothetical protein
MPNDHPAPPVCAHCREPMTLARTVPPLGALPELLVFLCPRCRHVDTKAQERAADAR